MSNSRHDIVRCDSEMTSSSLFRPLSRKRKRGKLDVVHAHAGHEFHWRGPDALGIPEETLLLVILRLACRAHWRLTERPQTQAGVALRSYLSPSGLLEKADVVCIKTCFSELSRGCGYDTGGASLRLVRTMLKRLVEVTLWTRINGLEGSSRLLSWLISDDSKVCIALSRRLAAPVLWDAPQFVSICLDERLALHSTVARALHARLSAQLREGNSWTYRLDSLEQKVWGGSATGSTRRTRHQLLKKALSEIGELRGWSVATQGGVWRVVRPPRNNDDASSE